MLQRTQTLDAFAPSVDVVVVAHNGARTIGRAISSLMASTGVRVRVLVVDNASVDDTAALAGHAGAVVLRLPSNVGYGAGFNVGFSSATATWVVCANQDISVEPSALHELIAAALQDEVESGRPCIAGPRLVDNEGRTAETGHRLPSALGQAIAFVLGERRARLRNVLPNAPHAMRCGWVSGAFLLAKRATFEAVGAFDSAYFMYVEDVDIFARLARVGGHCLWVPAAAVHHFGGSQKAISPKLYAGALCNWARYFRRHHGRLASVFVFLASLVGSVARVPIWLARWVLDNPSAMPHVRMFAYAPLLAVAHALRFPSSFRVETSSCSARTNRNGCFGDRPEDDFR